MKSETVLPREFYLRNADAVAPELLGKLLVHRSPEGITAGMIVETEAYVGSCDKGAHAYPYKRTPRTEIQFGQGGHAYVYSIYGMYDCFNVVTNVEEQPEVVLIRALKPVEGIELMKTRSPKVRREEELCSGPGRLCRAMGITKALYGEDLCGETLYITGFQPVPESGIMVSPRINIDYAEECRDYLWRYFVKDEPCVSKAADKYVKKQQKYANQA